MPYSPLAGGFWTANIGVTRQCQESARAGGVQKRFTSTSVAGHSYTREQVAQAHASTVIAGGARLAAGATRSHAPDHWARRPRADERDVGRGEVTLTSEEIIHTA